MLIRWWWLLLLALAPTACERDTELLRVRTDLSTPERIDFGAVSLGGERDRELTLVNESRLPLEVQGIQSGVASVQALGPQAFTVGPGQTHSLTLRFSPSVEGPVEGAVQLATGGAETGLVQVALAGTGVRSRLEAAYDGLDFGDVEVDTTVLLNLPLTNVAAAATQVRLSFDGEDGDLFVSSLSRGPVTVEAGEELQVPIAFSPSRLGAARALLRVEPCAGCEPLLVDLSGNGVAAMLEIAPSRVDFGRVEVGARAERQVTVRNNGSEALTYRGSRILEAAGADFRVELEPAQGTPIAPGRGFELRLSFSPTAQGPVRGPLLEVGLRADNAPDGPFPKLPLQGEGGLSCLWLEPALVAFGEVPQGHGSVRTVEALNRCSETVRIIDADVQAKEGGYFSLLDGVSGLTVSPGATVPLRIRFQPQPESQTSTGHLSVRAEGAQGEATSRVQLSGTQRAFAPCALVSLQPALDFGRVQVGSRVTQGWVVEHRGQEACYLERLSLAAGSDPEFTAARVEGRILPPGGSALLLVDFLPRQTGVATALVEARFAHPTDPLLSLPVVGEGVQSCVALEPAQVDFGVVKRGCGPASRSARLHNRCDLPLELTQATLRTDVSIEGELTLEPAPALPTSVPLGASVSLPLRYLPKDDGIDLASLTVTTDHEGPLQLGIVAAGLERPLRTERFIQAGERQVDVLFVIDNSGSMMEEQQQLGENFQAFLSAAQATSVDYQIGVTTTGLTSAPGGWSVCPGGAEGGEAGRLFPVDGSTPRIIRPDTPDAATVFARNVNVGWCHWNEQGLEAAYRALSPPLVNHADDPSTSLPSDGNLGFLREGAKLVLVFLSDEDDFSPQSLSFYETFFRGLKGGDESRLAILALVGPRHLVTCPTAAAVGARYLALAEATGGVAESICTRDWAGSLEILSASAFGPRRLFPLAEMPEPVAELEVRVDGLPVEEGWAWDAAAQAVRFDEDATPAAGSIVEITYPVGC